MPRGFAGERESSRASDPSGRSSSRSGRDDTQSNYEREAFGSPPSRSTPSSPSVGGSGVGRQDGPGSRTEGNQLSGINALVEKINRDIDSGVNVFADSYQKQNARDILADVYGDKQEAFGITSPSVASQALKSLGYDTAKPFLTNVYDNVVPGRNTPLGILSAVPSVMGFGKAPQLAVTIANRLAANQAAQVPEPVSPVSEVIPTIDFTGRPDDAPIPTIEFTPNTIAPSGFTRIDTGSTEFPDINRSGFGEVQRLADSLLSDEEFGEMLERDRQRRVNEGLIDNYLQSQADVGVFTPPMPSPDLGDTRPLPTMFGERPDVQEFGGFADPLTDKTLFDMYNERMLGLQTPKVGI
jgi:hypothetical protein|tara:strand:- start:302 stop:1363 length:1062 start_codon:yes stop_codon:yes gene_type:complete